VALLDVLDDPTDSQEVWCHPHTLLTRGAGAKEEHALLLCALLLGFGLDAYVAVGKDASAGAAWVVTRGAPGVTVRVRICQHLEVERRLGCGATSHHQLSLTGPTSTVCSSEPES
jgi:hypothetical protein